MKTAKIKEKKGMALMMVLSTTVFVILLIQETVFETQTEYRSATAELNSLRAYYAAKAGMEVNILRVKAYVKIHKNKNYEAVIRPLRAYMDLMWRFPFHWPPRSHEEMNKSQITAFSKVTNNSLMTAKFFTSIEPEAGRVDINDLASPIPSLRKRTFDILYRLIHILAKNQGMEEELSGRDIMNIVHNIKDWADQDSRAGESNTSEADLYDQEGLPPNRSFLSPQELKKVAGMTDTLYTALSPFITVYGEKALNINTAGPELLQALHEEFPEELAGEIAELSSNPLNPFVFTEDSFKDFLSKRGFDNLNRHLFPESPQHPDSSSEPIPAPYLRFDPPHNFRMQSQGVAGNSQKTLTAVFVDPNSLAGRFKELIERENTWEKERIKKLLHGQVRTDESRAGRQKSPSEKPLEYMHRAPFIIYWKERF